MVFHTMKHAGLEDDFLLSLQIWGGFPVPCTDSQAIVARCAAWTPWQEINNIHLEQVSHTHTHIYMYTYINIYIYIYSNQDNI